MRTFLRWVLVALVVAGLAVDAFTHFDLAHNYDLNTTGSVNEGVLFRIEATVAAVVAVWVLVRQDVVAAAVSALVSGGGAFVLILFRYADLGRLGPIPNMYEPIWYREKVFALIGELVAFVASLVLLGVLLLGERARRAKHGPASAATLRW